MTFDAKFSSELPQLPPNHVSSQRLAPYMTETSGDRDKAIKLYDWDRDLSAAFFRDISILEVALRNSIDRALCKKYGELWYQSSAILFDSRTFKQISKAWCSLPAEHQSYDAKNRKVRGRLVAACTFGVWVNILDKGGKTDLRGPCAKADHDRVWDRGTLLEAFPGAGQISGREDGMELDRKWVHQQVRKVHLLRNRVAHHESLINGVPITGEQNGKNGKTSRMSIDECRKYTNRLAAMMDRNLYNYLINRSNVLKIIKSKPEFN